MAKFRVTAWDGSFPPQKVSDRTYILERVAKRMAKRLREDDQVKAIFINDKKVY